MDHLSEQHPRTRERHHCLLCERSFPTAERHRLHLAGRTHRHLELTQRRTIHTLYSIFRGRTCPVLPPLTETERAGLNWFPVEPGTIHFYHQATPLQRAIQVTLFQFSILLVKILFKNVGFIFLIKFHAQDYKTLHIKIMGIRFLMYN